MKASNYVIFLAITGISVNLSVVRVQSQIVKTPEISTSDWHKEMETVATAFKTYELAKKANRLDMPEVDKLLGVPDVFLSLSKLQSSIAQMRAADAVKELTTTTNNLKAEAARNKGVQLHSTDELRQYQVQAAQSLSDLHEKQETARQAVEAWTISEVHRRLLATYGFKILPAPANSQDQRAANEKENQAELEKLWANPEYRDLIRRSWKTLMKEADFLLLPDCPFPLAEIGTAPPVTVMQAQAVESGQTTEVTPSPTPRRPPEKTWDKPHIYLHIASESQRKLAETIKQRLTKAGMIVVGIENVATSPNVPEITPELRYYTSRDSEEARQIATSIQPLLGSSDINPNIPDGGGYVSHSRQYEFWFSRSFGNDVKQESSKAVTINPSEIRANINASNAIYDASHIINHCLDEMDGLRGPNSVANYGETHKGEIEAAAKVLEENKVTGIRELANEYQRLKIQSFDNTLDDFVKATINRDLAAVRLKLVKKVQAAMAPLVPAKH